MRKWPLKKKNPILITLFKQTFKKPQILEKSSKIMLNINILKLKRVLQKNVVLMRTEINFLHF